MKKTKIVCSIGPSSNKYETFKEMVLSGMNVARINFSHATREERECVVNLVKQANRELHKNLAIMYDTKGPDFRTGLVENGNIQLIEGNTIKLVKEDIIGNKDQITVNYKECLDAINVDDTILLEDGLMKLSVIEKTDEYLNCKIISGGNLGDRKGINVPGVDLAIKFLSEQDIEDIKYACHNSGDFLALSFVSSKDDVIAVRNLIKNENSNMKIISKIESYNAINNIDEIIDVSDGIMVARGDLGVEIPMEQLPIIQKSIIKKCREKKVFCIVATEMLASMSKNSRPTRAEVSDVANAVIDGADAIMLSGETTTGKFPIDAVSYMAKIAENTEKFTENSIVELKDCQDDEEIIAASATNAANNLNAKAILVGTKRGRSAKLLSNLRPNSIIIANCINEQTAIDLAFYYGVHTTVVPEFNDIDDMILYTKENAKNNFELNKGDKVIITGGFPITKGTNFLKIEEI